MKRSTKLFVSTLIWSLSCAGRLYANSAHEEAKTLTDLLGRVAISGRGTFLYSLEYRDIDLQSLNQSLADLGFGIAESISARAREMASTLYDVSTADNPKSNEYRLDAIVFSGERYVVRRSVLTRDEYMAIRANPYEATNMPQIIYAYDGSKTIRIEGKLFSNQMFHAVHFERDRIDVPDIWSFGLDPSFREFVESEDWKRGIVRKFASNETVTVEFEDMKSPVPFGDLRRYVRWVVNTARGHTLERIEAGYLGYLMREEECGDYVALPSGRWYPRLRILRHYAPISQSPALVKEERYEALVDSVEMDVDISEHELNPALPCGASGTDFTTDPPRNFLVGSDGAIKHLD